MTTPNHAGTGTPRPTAILARELMCWSVLPLGDGVNQYAFHADARESAERLTQLATALTALQTQLEEARKDQWQPMATAPRDETEVLLKTRIGVVSAWFHDELDEHFEWVCYDDLFTIPGDAEGDLMWMPLPALATNLQEGKK